MKHKKDRQFFKFIIILLTALCAASAVIGQVEPNLLLLGETIEREMTGAQTHRYKFDLKKDEFFQVRIEQKGVDVILQLKNANGNLLATMDSPNGKEGFEILTYVTSSNGVFTLEVISPNEKAEKGIYIIKRETSRPAIANDKRRVEVEKLFVEGIKARDEKQAEAAIKKLTEALAGWKELKDDYLTELTAQQVRQIEINALFMSFYDEFGIAVKILKEAQTILVKSKADSLPARKRAVEALSAFRALNSKLSDKTIVEKIISLQNEGYIDDLKVLQVFTKIQEVNSLDAIAQAHYNLGEWQKRIDYLKQAIDINQELIDNEYFKNSPELYRNYFIAKAQQASNLVLVGQMLYVLGQPDKAIEYYSQALQSYDSLFQETQNAEFKLDKSLFNFKLQEALVLIEIGNAYGRNSENRARAIGAYSKGVEIYKSFPDKKREIAYGLFSIGDKYAQDLNYEIAFKTLDESLKYFEELNDEAGKVTVLSLKGVLYFWLNNKTKVSEIFTKVIEILQSPDFNESRKKSTFSFISSGVLHEKIDDFIERERLEGIATAYKFLENFQKSNEYYERSLLIARSNQENGIARITSSLIAFNYASMKQWDKASEYYQQAITVSRNREVKEELADDLRDVGWALIEAGKPQEALNYQNEAFLLYQSVGVSENKNFTVSYSGLLNEISQTHYALGNKRLAILYGKRAVNAIQIERQRLQNLDLVSQKGFLERKEKHYRRLADLLIEAGRIVEAEKVLQMLKEEEVADYLRRDKSLAEKLSLRIEYTAAEERAIKDFAKNSEAITAIGAEFGKLEDLKRNGVKLSAEQEKRFEELKIKLAEANAAFQDFLNQLAEEFKKNKDIVNEVQEDKGLQTDLAEWGEGVVFVYTLVGEERYRTILYTPNALVDEKAEIKSADLNKKIFEFRQQVQNPSIDPRPLGKELYDILIKPIEAQLEGAKAKTILWSLDGNLRLLPLAALWDGKQYFGQKYQNVLITLASRSRIGREVSINLNVLGLGVSEPKTVQDPFGGRSLTFDALPAVSSEITSIVRNKNSSKGVLPGEILLNGGFTQKALETELVKGYKIIHIASHFSLNAGDASRSFLLLGDGTALSVNEMNINPSLKFNGVELLTLSACETAVSGMDGTGKEVEGFAYVAQQNGAKAILATLWSVADESTQILMTEFYRLKKENPQMTKTEAMQKAQLAMIQGKLKPSGANSGCRSNVVKLDGTKERSYKCDANMPFAHPFYWSPFVLIGNWR